MTAQLERFSGFFPAAIGFALPALFLTVDSDAYILPRTAIVLAGACLGAGMTLLTRGHPGLGRLRWPILAAALAALAAFAFSVSRPLSLAGSYTRYESLPTRLGYLGLLAASVWLLRTERQRRWLIAAFVLGTSLAAVEAVEQWLGHASFRPDGNLGNANLLAALETMAIPLAIERGLRLRWYAIGWWICVILLAAGLVATTSRSGLIGTLAGTGAMIALGIRGRRPAVAAAGFGAALVLGGGLLIQLSPLRDLNADPASLRLNLWRDGLHLIAARPITGWGEDTTGLVFGRFLSGDYARLVTFDRIHSGPLDIAATQGLLGLGALTWLVAVILVGAWRRRLDADVAALTGALTGYAVWVVFNFDWAPATGAFWLLAGALWSAANAHDRRDEGASSRVPPDRRQDPAPGPLRSSAAFLLALLALLIGPLPVLADAWYVRGRSDLAAQADPLQAQYHWALGEGLVARGQLARGVAELRVSAQLGESEPGLYVELGDREAQLGDRSAARAAYRRALEIDPYYTPAQQRLAALGA